MQTRPLHSMFTAVPRRYDLVNHVITWGLDRHWRQKAASECLVTRPRRVLDLCCGTGDLAIAIARLGGSGVEVAGIDFSEPMLGLAAAKAAATNTDMTFVYGDAAALPFADGYFDCVGISFAFRNLTYKNPLVKSYLSEVYRVLAPGGKFVIAETSQPGSSLIRTLYHLYLRCFVTNAGRWLSGNRSAYRYLAESARRFYNTGEVRNLLLASGFKEFTSRPLLLGAAAIYVAVK
jgi:demethylmenaquinone methyltransferase/2-methoxy-6-polyprenyl-1,4-benzoquinol methylase